MPETLPISDIIRRRSSCRSYLNTALEPEKLESLQAFISDLPPSPFGNRGRFAIFPAGAAERGALRKLGTYGFVRGAPAYLIGACGESGRALEDFGWQMERIILKATDLGWGTCWLGGTFTRSVYASRIAAAPAEIIPAVSPIGTPSEKPRAIDTLVRRVASSADRYAWSQIFCDSSGAPISAAAAGSFAEALEMVRLAPSASNKQPWRVVTDGSSFHFYLRRTPGYREGWMQRMLGVADLQRADLGIALCHFELSARALSLPGGWASQELSSAPFSEPVEYVLSWVQ